MTPAQFKRAFDPQRYIDAACPANLVAFGPKPMPELEAPKPTRETHLNLNIDITNDQPEQTFDMKTLSLEQIADYLEDATIDRSVNAGHALVHFGKSAAGTTFVLLAHVEGPSYLQEMP